MSLTRKALRIELRKELARLFPDEAEKANEADENRMAARKAAEARAAKLAEKEAAQEDEDQEDEPKGKKKSK